MLAEDLIDAHEHAREVPPFSERYPGLSSQAAYAAARALHGHRMSRGWQAVGRKVGFTNRTLWARYGVHEPMWGTVYDRTLILARDGRALVPLEGLVQPRIEPEMAFRLKATPASSEPEALLAAIDWIAHSVEIVQCHHAGWKVTIADCCADNGLHGRLIVGDSIPISEISDVAARLPGVEVLLFRAGELKDRGMGTNVLGSPLLSLGFLIELLRKHGDVEGLRPGEIVTTGVITDAHPVRAGEIWNTRIEGLPLPGLTIEFS